MRAERNGQAVVYFIQAGDDGPVKIGSSSGAVQARLDDLQIGNAVELRLLGTLPGGAYEERRLHRHFHETRVRGEWFAPTVELLAVARGEFPWTGDHVDVEPNLDGPDPSAIPMDFARANERNKIEQLYDAGFSLTEIADCIGRSVPYVRREIDRMVALGFFTDRKAQGSAGHSRRALA